jgi:PAS domain-containing protein
VQDRGYLILNATRRTGPFCRRHDRYNGTKASAAQLEEQAALLQQSHDAVLICELDGNVRYWNSSAERIFGWSAEEAINRNTRELVYVEPEERNSILDTA